MMTPQQTGRAASPSLPGGATLVEVLMSLLIMSIGIVSVITMFPIAVLRSIQATQLTNARMMTQNTEQTFRTLFRDSAASTSFDVLNYHFDPSISVTPNNLQTFRGTWQPNTPYRLGQIVTASRPKGQYSPHPEQWMRCVQAGGSGSASGSVEPDWSVGGPNLVTTDGSASTQLQWVSWYDPTAVPLPTTRRVGGPDRYPAVITFSNGATSTYYSARNYVVDPLGWATFNNDASDLFNNAYPNDFGFAFDKSTGLAGPFGTRPTTGNTANANSPYLLRINGGATSVAAAEALATHPDSWSVEIAPTTLLSWATVAGTPSYAGYRQAVFANTVDLTAVTATSTGTSSGECRIILSSLTSSQSYARDIAAVNATTRTVAWNEPLPIGFEPDGPARIERRDRRYTWLATVNKDFQGHTRVTVVTFFKRGLKPEEEHLYAADVGNLQADQVKFSWNVATDPTPLIREGNYLFDGLNASWYRIVAVSISGTTAVITLDRPVPLVEQTASGRVMLMRGIVELFELKL